MFNALDRVDKLFRRNMPFIVRFEKFKALFS